MCGGVLRIFTGLYFLSISTGLSASILDGFCFLFFGWILIWGERGFLSGLCPDCWESRIGADFFIFFGFGLVRG